MLKKYYVKRMINHKREITGAFVSANKDKLPPGKHLPLVSITCHPSDMDTKIKSVREMTGINVVFVGE